ncbi:cysteine--tRNA ligase [Bacillaceae bacterium]
MSIRLYNTLTRKKEEFHPLEPGKVKMYVCGPTVYHYIHIGNARPAIIFDVVRRYLEYKGFQVTYIQNFTDVDDKLIKRAEETGESVREIADRFIRAYEEDVRALGVKEADAHPRVSDHIPDIIAFIERLIAKGAAYEAEGDVYFSTAKFPEYGKLSHQSIEDLKAGARVEVNEKKRNPLDFALWKKAKPGEIYWDSPWGPGRPGWHIECSAMAMKYLGESFDIHAGGHDLTFPHHENEIAQTESLTGRPMARYWLHNGYINIDDQKMSKSLGNVVIVRELREKFSPQAIRFFILSAHYRNPINFSEELLRQAANSLERITTAVRNLRHRFDTAADGEAEPETFTVIEEAVRRFEEKMDDDFNTADAIAVIFDLVREANTYLLSPQVRKATVEKFLQTFETFGGILGLPLAPQPGEALLDEEIEALIAERSEARKRKDYKRADEIRDYLHSLGIILEDTPQGVRWRRKERAL